MLITLATAKAAAVVTPLVLNSKDIQKWVLDNVVFLMIVFIGVVALAYVKKKDIAGMLTIGLGVLFALSWIVTPELWVSFAKSMSNLAIG